ncbi:hypothetical protein J2X58_003527 [Luteibacter sp. 3190]|nr:hypothetical protein [Luteibacter sp. 3190]
MGRDLGWGALQDRLTTTNRMWIKKLARNDRTRAYSPAMKAADVARGHGVSKQNGKRESDRSPTP